MDRRSVIAPDSSVKSVAVLDDPTAQGPQLLDIASPTPAESVDLVEDLDFRGP